MRTLIFAGITTAMLLMPVNPIVVTASAAVAMQDTCVRVTYPDGSEGMECPSTATTTIQPPPDANATVAPRRCDQFPYRFVPAHPSNCAVTESYIAIDGYPVYILTCCS